MCEKRHDDTLFYDSENQELVDEYMWERIASERCVKYKPQPYPHLVGGAYVSAMGKHIILGVIKQVLAANGKFLYCDTDSVIFEATEKELNINFDDNQLGAYKIEKLANVWLYNKKLKKYCILWDGQRPTDQKSFESFKNARVPK